MDVVLKSNGDSASTVTSSVLSDVEIAEPLMAQTYSELLTETDSLQRRRIRRVSVRRQQIFRIGEERMCEVLTDRGIAVSTLNFAGGFTGTIGHSFAQAVCDTRRALETAARFSAAAIVVVPGSRGLHTYQHAEQTIREGLNACLDDALRLRINMLVPLNSVLGHRRDVFQPRNESRLDWVRSFNSHRIRGLMVLRGKSPWDRLPDCWVRCLDSGGCLRISRRCRVTLGLNNLLNQMLAQLNSSGPILASLRPVG